MARMVLSKESDQERLGFVALVSASVTIVITVSVNYRERLASKSPNPITDNCKAIEMQANTRSTDSACPLFATLTPYLSIQLKQIAAILAPRYVYQ